jgi:S1-C subfamily serine protease
MTTVLRSHFVSAVVGGLVVGAGFAAFGALRATRTQTVFQEAPVAAAPTTTASRGLTAQAIYSRESPGVVLVRAHQVAPVQSPFSMFHTRGSSTVTGSGFLIDRQGDILTANHVVDGADRSEGVSVEFEDAIVREARVVAVDPGDDLAVIRVSLHGVTPVRPLPLGDSASVRVGDPTLAIGNPSGLERTLTSGIVSALQHEITAAGGASIDNVIQTDQTVSAGDTGGPLLDGQGRVIGINSQLATSAAGGAPVSFAVPIDTADPILATARQGSGVRVAYLGISGPGPAAGTIAGVLKGSPAQRAGLRRGDAIERVDGDQVRSVADVLAVVRTRSPGQTMELQVRHGVRHRRVTVVLGSRAGPSGG